MENLTEKYKQIQRDVLQASFDAGACHIGSALSCVDILVPLFYGELKDDDIFLFSKASGAATYYSILADKGLFPREKIAYYLKNYPLPSVEVPGVVHSCGSLGHGLPVAVGLALANRDQRVFVLMSDGEVGEGTTWESALFARQHDLDNLNVIIDANELQACGAVEEILDLGTAYDFLRRTLPNLTIEHTVKGKGVDFMEGQYEWHYRNLTESQLKQALEQI